MPWNPEQYNQFKAERALPFRDTLALIRGHRSREVVDLGCGTGELTAQLKAYLSDCRVTGIDNSAEMLAQAEQYRLPQMTFRHEPIENVSGDWDLIFSHAALQWVDNHPALFARLWQQLRPAGQLVVQMPSNHDHLTHRLIRTIAQQAPFAEALGGWLRSTPVLTIDAYAALLFELGGQEITVYEKVYPHVLSDAEALLDWVSGTTLVPYMERLTPELQQTFKAHYLAQLRTHFPGSPVFYGFRRILLTATRSQA